MTRQDAPASAIRSPKVELTGRESNRRSAATHSYRRTDNASLISGCADGAGRRLGADLIRRTRW